jgi:activator of 2-hydroxyglutaryl-CoA dehydratase
MHDHKGPQLIQIAPLETPPPTIQQVRHAHHGHDQKTEFFVGLDVGSTTVKAVVIDAEKDKVLWQDYQRHETKQPEKTLEFLKRMEAEVGISRHNTRMFMTGSGGNGIADQIGAKFVQEVTAVSLAVEKLHPEVYSVEAKTQRSSCSRMMRKPGARRKFLR